MASWRVAISVPLVVLLRGINVGGHRTLRPSLLARELAAFEVTNVGATGTFVVRKPGTQARFRAALRARLPETTRFVLCEGRDLLRLAAEIPFDRPSRNAERTQFVSFLASAPRATLTMPLTIPAGRDWFVRVNTVRKRLVVGEYRRHMKTIGHLGELDARFGTLVTTRSFHTVNAIVRLLKQE